MIDNFKSIQELHDVNYHSDIINLTTQYRMSHIVFHLVKYLRTLKDSSNYNLTNKDFVDAFIMVVSASNLLNIKLIEQSYVQVNIVDSYITCITDLAKACESLDHIEYYPIKQTWINSISTLFNLLISCDNTVDIIEQARIRLIEVEQNVKVN